MDEPTALPCPFCGCPRVEDEPDNRGGVYIHCPRCFASTASGNDRAAALELWNRRPAPPDPAGTLRVEAIRAFVERVNARAEADMLAGNPITGAHHRALTAELAALDGKARSPR